MTATRALSQDERSELVYTLRESLAHAARLDGQGASLASRIADLEVRRIELDMNLAKQAVISHYGSADRTALGELLLRRDAIAVRLSGLLGNNDQSKPASDDELPCLKEAADALEAWIKAKEPKTSKRVEMSVRVVMLLAVLVALWGAFEVHWAVLVLLIPVVGPLSALLNRGEDAQWVRLGAKRRFSGTGLPAPPWELAAVQNHLESLQKTMTTLEAARATPPPLAEPLPDAQMNTQFAELSIEQVEVELTLKARLRQVGLVLDELDPTVANALRTAGEAGRLRRELGDAAAEHSRVVKEAGEHRDAIWRELNRLGLTQGDASTRAAVLAEKIALLERS